VWNEVLLPTDLFGFPSVLNFPCQSYAIYTVWRFLVDWVHDIPFAFIYILCGLYFVTNTSVITTGLWLPPRKCVIRAGKTNAESCYTTKTSDRDPLRKETHQHLPTPSFNILKSSSLMYLFSSLPLGPRQSFRYIQQQGNSVTVHFISWFLNVQFIVPRNNHLRGAHSVLTR
jgi:hypothetical protein